MSYSLVVFDWDGTLMDSTHSIVAAIQGACRDLELAVPSASDASWVIGLSLESALRRAVPELTQAMLPRFLERYRTHYLLHAHTRNIDAVFLFRKSRALRLGSRFWPWSCRTGAAVP